MKHFKRYSINILLFFLLAALVKVKGESSEEEEYKYECANKFFRYQLDNEPAEYGFSAGHYGPGKKAYVGISQWRNIAYHVGRIQIEDRGIELCNVGGNNYFYNDSSQIWYLHKNKHHKYEWVDSSDGKIEPFAIEFGAENGGFKLFIGRIQQKNKPVIVGIVVSFMGVMYYADQDGRSKNVRTGYQVLTCKSCRKEEKIPTPKIAADMKPNADDPNYCINNWVPYNNNDDPITKGVSAGPHDCGNIAYVGKGKDKGVFIPGRIQTNSPAGFYSANANKPIYLTNSSFYLANNPNYTYYWKPFDKDLSRNTVYVRNDVGSFTMAVLRVKVKGRVLIGKFLYPVSPIADENGIDSYFEDYEVLVCDPWPKYKCAQQWKKLNANDSNVSTDGFSVDSTTFIGRSIRKCINGCDYGLGKIQAASNGVNFLDDLTATAVFDNSSNVEYLVKNSANTYKWQPSRNGVKVVNALELHKEGHRPFYIGTTRINGNIIVGKVRPGEGLFFIDPITGKQQSTSSYEVLTCTSPDASNGVDEEKSDADWFGSFGCPVRKQWSFTKWRCVCRDEFKGVFASKGATWSEETCSYVKA